MKRTLTLKRETITDLTTEELAVVAGGLPTLDGPICYFIKPSGAQCTATIIQAHCNTL